MTIHVPDAGAGKTHTTGYNAELDRLRKSGRGQRVRDRVIKRYPICTRCKGAPSEICDHIVPALYALQQVRDSGRFPLDPNAGFFLESNLTGLCRSCHWTKTNEDKAHVGPWPDVLAAFEAQPKKKWSF